MDGISGLTSSSSDDHGHERHDESISAEFSLPAHVEIAASMWGTESAAGAVERAVCTLSSTRTILPHEPDDLYMTV